LVLSVPEYHPFTAAILQVTLGVSDWIFPAPRKPGHHIGRLNNTHNTACGKAALSFVLYDLRHTFGSLLIQDGASLAYVRDQMGHCSIQITVDTYGHLIPGADINWIDGLDRKTSPQQNATPAQLEVLQEEPESLDVVEKNGERGRNRTFNLLIKSQLLCQLSYAPFNNLQVVRNAMPVLVSVRFAQNFCAPIA
jgi:integrase-like protein